MFCPKKPNTSSIISTSLSIWREKNVYQNPLTDTVKYYTSDLKKCKQPRFVWLIGVYFKLRYLNLLVVYFEMILFWYIFLIKICWNVMSKDVKHIYFNHTTYYIIKAMFGLQSRRDIGYNIFLSIPLYLF